MCLYLTTVFTAGRTAVRAPIDLPRQNQIHKKGFIGAGVRNDGHHPLAIQHAILQTLFMGLRSEIEISCECFKEQKAPLKHAWMTSLDVSVSMAVGARGSVDSSIDLSMSRRALNVLTGNLCPVLTRFLTTAILMSLWLKGITTSTRLRTDPWLARNVLILDLKILTGSSKQAPTAKKYKKILIF